MKRFYLTLLLVLVGLFALAQNISVIDFYLAENDITARTYGTSVEDQNGNLCALIKVRTTEKGLWTFDVGMLGVTKTEMQNEAHAAEIWVYVPFGVTKITIQHERFGLIDKWKFPCDITKGSTYVMILNPAPIEPQQQFLVFQITPANASLEVNDSTWKVDADGNAMKSVGYGTYKYLVHAQGYKSEVGMITMDNPNKPRIVSISLTPISSNIESDIESSIAHQTSVLNDEESFSVNGVSFTMKYVEGGTFLMGDDLEKPIHKVTLNSYLIGETEVTQALWKAVMGSNPSYYKGNDLPVELVSWDDCQEFIRKLNKKTGKSFRLPTEAEWEYAARGGTKSTGNKYAGSNILGNVAWFNDNSNGTTHSVKRKSPNELGLYDMSGNVYEWCQDWFSGDYYEKSASINPQGPSTGYFHVLRGGGLYSGSEDCMVSSRYIDRIEKSGGFGFRLCHTK